MERDSFFYKLRRKGQIIAHRVFPHEMMARIYSRIVIKKNVDLKNPQTFNEKIQWSMLHYYPNNPLVVQCADKYAVREYIREKGLEKLLVPLFGAWKNADEIIWDELPNEFVLKCAHGCAYNILCKEKACIDEKTVKKQLNKWLEEDFGEFNTELHYSKINPRMIVCEEYLGECITDYKFFCFNGEPKYIYVSNDLVHDRQAQIGFFYLDGTKMPMVRKDYTDIPSVVLPDFFEEMKEAAKVLCEDFPFVRVDFFLANGRYYFAELTFTPSGGMMPFNPDEFDLEWGKMIDLSQIEKKYIS